MHTTQTTTHTHQLPVQQQQLANAIIIIKLPN
jgi:hypothetical protein